MLLQGAGNGVLMCECAYGDHCVVNLVFFNMSFILFEFNINSLHGTIYKQCHTHIISYPAAACVNVAAPEL